MSYSAPVIARMQSRIQAWETVSDDKALFLNCYMLMTSNMLAGIQQQEFADPVWVSSLLDHFADYYFVALEAYERDPASAPAVWQRALDAARAPNFDALQKLLLGVNAHINYDLVLTLADLLRSEWRGFSEPQRAARHADYCHVNAIIARTIDAVQDRVLEPAMPIMQALDDLLGPVDELMISQLITLWRDSVWRHTTRLLSADDAHAQQQIVREVEQEALRMAEFICGGAAPAV